MMSSVTGVALRALARCLLVWHTCHERWQKYGETSVNVMMSDVMMSVSSPKFCPVQSSIPLGSGDSRWQKYGETSVNVMMSVSSPKFCPVQSSIPLGSGDSRWQKYGETSVNVMMSVSSPKLCPVQSSIPLGSGDSLQEVFLGFLLLLIDPAMCRGRLGTATPLQTWERERGSSWQG